ncbi:SOS cell division inhibitor [Marinobacter sp. VGCF2001]|uniref:SOS cell division inhibitor n=1 Tax=Marinobacter sp. VGCF2001 TaxID=3417189 RepID=UPI003CF06A9B
MATPETLLSDLDQLENQLREALEHQDWERLSQLNARVRPSIEPLMTELEKGTIDAVLVRERLQALNRFVEEADAAATEARNEARASLKGMSQNRNAAKTYQNVSSNRQR